MIEPCFGSSVYILVEENKVDPIAVKKDVVLPKRRVQGKVGDKFGAQVKSDQRLKRVVKITPKISNEE